MQVPLRLQQLSQLMGGADQQAVLALTRRCPMVLGVEAGLMAPRLDGLCKLLQRPVETEVRNQSMLLLLLCCAVQEGVVVSTNAVGRGPKAVFMSCGH